MQTKSDAVGDIVWEVSIDSTAYEKREVNYQAMAVIAAIAMWLPS